MRINKNNLVAKVRKHVHLASCEHAPDMWDIAAKSLGFADWDAVATSNDKTAVELRRRRGIWGT